MSVLDRLSAHATGGNAHAAAVQWGGGRMSYRELAAGVRDLSHELARRPVRTLAIDMDNGPAWALLDLAALDAGCTVVPIPPFFTASQVRHCIAQAGVNAVVTDNPGSLASRAGPLIDGEAAPLPSPLGPLCWVPIQHAKAPGTPRPANIAKITYTSGTTGEPRGVMLRRGAMDAVVDSLVQVMGVTPRDRHLALMPLAILLENIGSLHVPLWAGATSILSPMEETGMRGAAGLDGPRMASHLAHTGATTAIFTPQTLQALVDGLESGCADPPGALRIAAVGGAPVSSGLLKRARASGIPVYEGYGLSECASVVCLNTPESSRDGSVGRVLPHARVRIDADDEIWIRGASFSGYLGEAATHDAGRWWPTGDLGRLDRDGYLYLTGRRRNCFITAFGRNVAPEWVECELLQDAAIAQAAVFGEARPWNVAVLVPAPGADTGSISTAVERANALLPDYARIRQWVAAREPFLISNGQLTGTGRVRREQVFAGYQTSINALYAKDMPA